MFLKLTKLRYILMKMKFSIPHAYLGPHAYYFWGKCPPHMLIWDHTAIRATRVRKISRTDMNDFSN